MARISLDRVRALPDIISTTEFELILGNIPNWGQDRDLIVKCQQAVYPGTGNEAYEVPLAGYSMYFRGRKTYPRQLSLTFVEDRFLKTTNAFNNWLEYIVGTNSGTSAAYKRGADSGYSLDDVQLLTYDPTGHKIDTVHFFGVFPQDKPDVQYDGSSSQLYSVSVTLVYDYYTSDLTEVR